MAGGTGRLQVKDDQRVSVGMRVCAQITPATDNDLTTHECFFIYTRENMTTWLNNSTLSK